MNKLLPKFRNIGRDYSKRSICNVEVIYELFQEALNEGIKLYILTYAYDNQIYALGYENFEKIEYYYYLPDGNITKYDNLDSLKNSVILNHDITILREFQNNTLESSVLMPGTNMIIALGNTLDNENIAEVSIRDNFILKKYLVTEKDSNFNYNLSDELIKDYNQMLIKSKKEQKDINLFMIGIVVFLIAGIILAAIFGGK